MHSTLTQRVFLSVSPPAFACCLAVAPSLAQQTGSVQGSVVEANTNRPLVNAEVFAADPGVTVAAAVERTSTTTDDEGRYFLSAVPAGVVEIHVRIPGYTSQRALLTVLAAQTTDLDFELGRSVFALDEIVVSGAGGRVARKRLGNTIATVDASAFETAPVSTFSEALQARQPSVVVLSSGGWAGEGARIRIRGTNSISMSNEPVVYVDGVRIDNSGGFAGFTRNVGASPSRLDDISPEAIERIEILKGAAAATLYGSEASSGVIQIFMKKGRVGRPRFGFRIDQGISQIPDVVKPNAGFARDNAQAASMSELFGIPVRPFEVIERKSVKDMLETGREHSYSAQVSGSGEEVLYHLAGRAAFTDGPLGAEELGPARDLNRKYQGNISLTLFPRDRLQLRASGAFTDAHHETPIVNNVVSAALTLAASGKPELASCDASSIDPSQTLGETTPVCTGAGNPTGAVLATPREGMQTVLSQDSEHFNGSLALSWEATRSLGVEGLVGLDAVNERASNLEPFGWNVDGTPGPSEGLKSISTRNHREITVDAKLRWNERILGSRIASQLSLGFQGFIAETRTSGGRGQSFPSPGIEVVGAAADQSVVESALSKVNAGLFVQEQIGFRDVAFVTVGGRWDRNSTFGENAPAAFYPKASVSVVPSDLSSWNSSLLSTLRLRAAIGKSGLQPGATSKYTTYLAAATSEGPALVPEQPGNPGLKPERATEWEVGAELGLFDNRLGIDVTYWDRVTRNALIARQFPQDGGFVNSELDNVGELTGNGWELKLDALILDGDDVGLSLFASTSFLEELVTDMGGALPIKVRGWYPRYRNYVKEGFAPGTYFGAQLLPLCTTNPVYSGGANAGETRPCWTPGTTVPFDSNGDERPDSEDEFKTFLTATEGVSLDQPAMDPFMDDEDGDGDRLDHRLGKPTPDWHGLFGIHATLFDNLSINTLFEFRAGDYGVANLTDAFRRSHSFAGRNTRESAEVEATLLDPATQSDPEARLAAAMRWARELKSVAPCCSGLNQVEQADFLRWRELSVTYTTPASFARKLGLDNLVISFTGRNLHLFTTYSGVDPETNAIGRCGGGGEADLECNFLDSVEAWGLPLPRRYTISVRFGF